MIDKDDSLSNDEVQVLKAVSYYQNLGLFTPDQNVNSLITFHNCYGRNEILSVDVALEDLKEHQIVESTDKNYFLTEKGENVVNQFISISKL